MNDIHDVARINKAFLKNIGVMLPRIIDPNHVSRYKKKPSNTALKYVINKNSKVASSSITVKSALQAARVTKSS